MKRNGCFTVIRRRYLSRWILLKRRFKINKSEKLWGKKWKFSIGNIVLFACLSLYQHCKLDSTCFFFVSFICRLVGLCVWVFFPFGFYRWLRFNSLLIRRWSSRGSLVRSVFWKLPRLFFFPRFFWANCFLGKRKTVVYFSLADFSAFIRRWRLWQMF